MYGTMHVFFFQNSICMLWWLQLYSMTVILTYSLSLIDQIRITIFTLDESKKPFRVRLRTA